MGWGKFIGTAGLFGAYFAATCFSLRLIISENTNDCEHRFRSDYKRITSNVILFRSPIFIPP